MKLDGNKFKMTDVDLIKEPVPTDIMEYMHLAEHVMSDFDSPECEKIYSYFHDVFGRGEFDNLQISDFESAQSWLRFLAVQESDYQTMKKLRSRRLIVSFTSYPARIRTVSTVLEGIYNQSLQADIIILWLAEDQFPLKEAELPEELLMDVRNGKLFIRWCDDLKPHKKYFYAMQEYPDDVIVTIDDDVLYPENTLQKLYDSYLAYPDAISSIRTHVITVSEEGEVLPYKDWLIEMDRFLYKPSLYLMATGCQGILYPPHLLPDLTFDKQAIQKTCLCADDLWLKTMELLNQVPTVCASEFEEIKTIQGTQEVALYKSNQKKGGNDIQLRRIMDFLSGRGIKNVWESSFKAEDVRNNLSSRKNICDLTNQRYCDMRRSLNGLNHKGVQQEQRLQQVIEERDELNRKLKQAQFEKHEIYEKLQQTYKEKSEINAKLQQTYREKAERGEELKELKSHFLVRVDRKLRHRNRN